MSQYLFPIAATLIVYLLFYIVAFVLVQIIEHHEFIVVSPQSSTDNPTQTDQESVPALLSADSRQNYGSTEHLVEPLNRTTPSPPPPLSSPSLQPSPDENQLC